MSVEREMSLLLLRMLDGGWYTYEELKTASNNSEWLDTAIDVMVTDGWIGVDMNTHSELVYRLQA